MLFVFIYAYWCQTRFPYQTYVLFTIVTIGVTRGTGTAYRPKHIRLPPLLCGVYITYVYPRYFVELVLHTFTPFVLWSSYYIRLPPLFCGVCITYVYPRCFVEFVLHMFTLVVLWSSYYSINSFIQCYIYHCFCLFSIAIMCVRRITTFSIFIILLQIEHTPSPMEKRNNWQTSR